jgi:hypothetical protein
MFQKISVDSIQPGECSNFELVSDQPHQCLELFPESNLVGTSGMQRNNVQKRDYAEKFLSIASDICKVYIERSTWAKYIQCLRLWRHKHRKWGLFIEHELIRDIIAVWKRPLRGIIATHVISAHGISAILLIFRHLVFVHPSGHLHIAQTFILWHALIHPLVYIYISPRHLTQSWCGEVPELSYGLRTNMYLYH